MTKVEAYKANDGTLFETEEVCIEHNKKLEVDELFNNMFTSDANCFYQYGELRLMLKEDLIDLVKRFRPVFEYILEENNV